MLREVSVDRSQLLGEIADRLPVPGETVYLERCGGDYGWGCVDNGARLPAPGHGARTPDAWLFYSGSWPAGDPERLAGHLDDLLAEMESMCGGEDRCRWPLGQPYPFQH
jgi:hypothetical protein